MKWWYWLILESLILFGTVAWVLFFPSTESVDDFAKCFLGFCLTYFVESLRNSTDYEKENKMTDEEMAELYANEYGFGSDFNNITSQEANQAIEQAYLRALKAGRPQWHKVADGDLPKRTGEYLTNIGVLIWDYYGDGRYGWHTEFCEHCECMDDVDSDEVVAWCEIPKYEKE